METTIRFVKVKEVTYLRLEDIASYIRECGGGEETDVRWRLNKAAENLVKRHGL